MIKQNEYKRRISYQWKLFLPLVIVLWTMLLGIAAWQSYRASQYQRKFVAQQLHMVNKRVARAWRHNDMGVLNTFKSFVKEYYDEDPLFDKIRMTIFDSEWEPIDTLGQRITLDKYEQRELTTEMFERESSALDSINSNARRAFYLITPVIRGGDEYYVVSSLPNDDVLERYISGNLTDVWILVFIIAFVVTILAYMSTRHLGRNINLLSQFAERTANEPDYVPGTEFAHDELGDIARKIVKLYNDRLGARGEIEREHQMTVHTLEEKARQKRQLTNNINHELKTPIGVIKGYLDTIVDSPDMDEATRRHFLGKARDHANRLVNLVADISAITRLEEGENQIGTEQLDIHELVYVFANDARESGILGHFDMEIDIPLGLYVNGNGNLLVGMLMNLTKNAVNYSGGDSIKVEYLGEDADFYRFAFYDNGRGVPDASIEHLFDRFYRIDSGRARKVGGTGLGLAIVYNTIKAHGGTITVRNRIESGLEFNFTLPKWNL